MLWIALLGISLVVSFGIGLLRFSTVVNPLTLFSGIWGVAILLYQLRLSGLQSELTSETYQLLFTMIACFSLAFAVFYFFRIKKPGHRGSSVSVLQYSYSGVIFHFWIWLVASILEIAYSGGVPALWMIAGSSKTYFDFGIPSVHGLLAAYGLAIILIAFQKVITESDKRKKGRLVVVVSTILVFYLMIISRQVLMSALIEMTALFALSRKNIPWMKLLVGAVVVVFAFGLVGNFRTGYDSFMSAAQIESGLPEIFSGFYWVYAYLSMTVANINNMLAIGILQLGFYPILESFIPTVLSDILSSNAGVANSSYLVDIHFTVSGFVSSYYEGFGLLGVAGGSALYGAISGVVYRKFIESPCERNALLYAIVIEIVLLSFFTDMLLYLPNGFQLVIVCWLYSKMGFRVRERKFLPEMGLV